MNSINGVLVRIQEILTRIQEIRATDGRVQGYGPSSLPTSPVSGGVTAPTTPKTATAPAAASTAPSGSTVQGLSPSKSKEFQQLLEQTLAAQSGGLGLGSSAGSGGLLSGSPTGLGSLPNLQSILGANAASGTTNTQALQHYQQELLQALQRLAAQKKQGSM